MRTLYIDLAGAERVFALVQDDTVIGTAPVEDHRAEEKLMPAIDALLKDASWNREDLNRVAAVTGPGGFMTIRVEISLVNAIAYALKIPVAGIHLSDVWHARVACTTAARSLKPEACDCIWLHSTKKTHAFVRGFGTLAQLWPEAVLAPIDEIASTVPSGALWMGELIPEHVAALPGIKRIENPKPLEKVLPGILSGLTYEEKTLLPWYGRGA